MGERGQGGQARQAGVGEVPAVAGLQVLQRRQPRAVLQRGVRQPLVALPAAPQLLRASQEQPSQPGRRGDAITDRLSTHQPRQPTGRMLSRTKPASTPGAKREDRSSMRGRRGNPDRQEQRPSRLARRHAKMCSSLS